MIPRFAYAAAGLLLVASLPIHHSQAATNPFLAMGANANPYVPIIMLTGHSEKKRVIPARDAGVTEFLAKPISAKALYQRILNIVANPRPFIKSKSYFGPDPPSQRVGELYWPRAPQRRC
jgi:DNA-binding NtrC family response regulator